MMYLYIGVYLVGCVLAYIMFRKDIKRIYNGRLNWSVGDRSVGLLLALFSWVIVLITCASMFFNSDYMNKKANW